MLTQDLVTPTGPPWWAMTIISSLVMIPVYIIAHLLAPSVSNGLSKYFSGFRTWREGRERHFRQRVVVIAKSPITVQNEYTKLFAAGILFVSLLIVVAFALSRTGYAISVLGMGPTLTAATFLLLGLATAYALRRRYVAYRDACNEYHANMAMGMRNTILAQEELEDHENRIASMESLVPDIKKLLDETKRALQDAQPITGPFTACSGDGQDFWLINGRREPAAIIPPAGIHPTWQQPPAGAQWIAHRWPMTVEERHGTTVVIERIFRVPEDVISKMRRGIFFAKVDDFLTLELNGKQVGDQMAGYTKTHERDIGAYLLSGMNVLRLTHTNAKRNALASADDNPMAISYRIEIDYRGGQVSAK